MIRVLSIPTDTDVIYPRKSGTYSSTDFPKVFGVQCVQFFLNREGITNPAYQMIFDCCHSGTASGMLESLRDLQKCLIAMRGIDLPNVDPTSPTTPDSPIFSFSRECPVRTAPHRSRADRSV